MLDIAFWVLVGAFVGWHIPEPTWAKVVKAKIMAVFQKKDSKLE